MNPGAGAFGATTSATAEGSAMALPACIISSKVVRCEEVEADLVTSKLLDEVKTDEVKWPKLRACPTRQTK